MFRSFVRSTATLGAAVVIALVGTSVAYAGDDLISDGDGAVPVSSNALAFGTVCKGTAQSRTVAFALRHAGGGSVFANGASVAISLLSAPPGVTGGSFGTIVLPSGWVGSSNGSLSSATTGVVTIDTSAVKTYSGSVTFQSTGAKDGGGTLTRPDGIAISGSVVACDSTPPVLTLPGPITAEATSASGAVVTYTVSATDAVDGARPVTCAPASGSTFALGATTVNCSASDLSGNTANGSFTVTVADTTGPALTLPASQTLEATSTSGAVATFTATASDTVDGARPVTCTPSSGAIFALGLTTVHCSASDTHGNTSSGSFSVTVHDTTAPVLALPAPIVAEATSAAGAAVTYSASATDIADASVPVTCDQTSGSTFPFGTTVVHCSGTDDSGNKGTGSFPVTVGDTTDPQVTISGPATVEATGPGGAVVDYLASATDEVTSELTPDCAPASGTTFALGTATITCTATDGAGNTGSATHDVEVVDTTPPALTLPADIVVEATSAAGATVPYTASASDLVDGSLTVTCDHLAGTFALGVTTVSCSVTDAHLNTASDTFTVTVEDTTAPALTLPGTLTAEATGAAGAGVTFDPTALDIVSGSMPVVCAPVSGSVFALGTTHVSCAATDAAGNKATGSFDVVVQDTTDPALHLPPGVIAEATSAAGAEVTYLATADDLVDPDVDVVCTPASGTQFALGTTTVSCTATDDAGNDVTDSFDVHVVDSTAPVVTVPADVVAEATSASGAAVTYTASATDAVTTAVTPDCTPASGTAFGLATTTVSCTATDTAGNTSAPETFTVTVHDTTAPVLTMPADQTLEATGPDGAVATFATTATDAVSTVTPLCTPGSGSTFSIGANTVDCTVTDDAGNHSDGSFTVTVQDTTPPVLHLPANVEEEATGSAGNAVTFTATAADVVDGARPVTCAPPSGSTFPVDTTTVSCSASDTHGNAADGAFTVTVKDKTAPDVTVPGNATVEATSSAGAVHAYIATAHDVVDGDLTPDCAPASGATFPLGVTSVGCSATDTHGNTGTGGFTVKVEDTVAPVVTAPADTTLEATGPGGAVATFTASATDAVTTSPAVTCTPPSGSTFPLGVTTVTCTATDGAGNTGSASFHVTVQDTTAPVLTVPSSVTKEASGPSGATVTYAASATDLVSSPLTPACNPASGTTFGLGTTTVVCTVTDDAGNPATASFAVHVVDTHAPTLTVPADFVVAATTASGSVVTYSTGATDTVTPSVPVVCSPTSGAAFPVGSTGVGCSATDGAGNTATASFTVSVRYQFSGFLQPINDTAHQTGVSESKFKLGSTVPVRFRLATLGGASVAQAGNPSFARAYRGGSCDYSTDVETTPDTTSTSGIVYRFDTSMYTYNFSTKGLTAGEWRLWALTADGAGNWVDLCLTK